MIIPAIENLVLKRTQSKNSEIKWQAGYKDLNRIRIGWFVKLGIHYTKLGKERGGGRMCYSTEMFSGRSQNNILFPANILIHF